ncbi:MAG: 50S ribosomal protein L6 [Candidatus Marinimicrobia bacterium]|nr:50S ribosomal protein L6 [Candidatus Neomarinimicrobiota bacterium]
MSRIGKNPINIPDGVKVTFQDSTVQVVGPKGQLEIIVHPDITVVQEDNTVIVTRASDSRNHRALHGTIRQLVSNAIIGVSIGYTKELLIKGVGYQATVENNRMILQLGYSHAIIFDPPDGITLDAKRTDITVFGIDKQLVGEVSAKIRSFRKPEPYKGKGIRYKDEYVRIKQGKTVGS